MKIVLKLLFVSLSVHSFAQNIRFVPTETMLTVPTETVLTDKSIESFEMMDVNNDGKLDIVWQAANGEVKYRLQSHGQSTQENTKIRPFHSVETMLSKDEIQAGIKTFKMVDMNYDGKPDIVWTTPQGDFHYKLQVNNELWMHQNNAYNFTNDYELYKVLNDTKWQVSYERVDDESTELSKGKTIHFKQIIRNFECVSGDVIDNQSQRNTQLTAMYLDDKGRVRFGGGFSVEHEGETYVNPDYAQYIIEEISDNKMRGTQELGNNEIVRWTATKITE